MLNFHNNQATVQKKISTKKSRKNHLDSYTSVESRKRVITRIFKNISANVYKNIFNMWVMHFLIKEEGRKNITQFDSYLIL